MSVDIHEKTHVNNANINFKITMVPVGLETCAVLV